MEDDVQETNANSLVSAISFSLDRAKTKVLAG